MLVVGSGLIGGSIAIAARQRAGIQTIVGVDTPTVLRRGLELGIIDHGAPPDQLEQALRHHRPDLVVFAAPVPIILDQLEVLARSEHQPVLALDTGSTKQAIVARAEQLQLATFIGGHPMAGREHGGLEHARGELLTDCRFVLCPSPSTEPEALATAIDWLHRLGAVPLQMDALAHDRGVALMSHLPHLLAWTLMRTAEDHADEHLWSLAAGSWRDATRVAASDPDLWESIFASNRAAIQQELERWLAIIDRARAALDDPQARVSDALDSQSLASRRRSLVFPLPFDVSAPVPLASSSPASTGCEEEPS